MSAPDVLWMTEADVVSLMNIGEAVAALQDGLLAEARGEAQNMHKTHLAWGDGATLHALGAVFPKRGFAGTKTWAHTPEGATPLLILYDSGSGALRAVIEAFALGQMRTGAAAGVATRCLAAQEAREMAIIGTGKQAIAQVAAVAAVRPLRSVRVYGRNEERRRLFAERVEKGLAIAARAVPSVAEAVRGAPIITTVTRAEQPFLTAAMVARGAHINAMGAITPKGAEVAADVLGRCDLIVADSPSQAQKLSRELMDHFGSARASWQDVRSLADVVAQPPRRAGGDVSLFKSLGMGISDLCLAIELYRRGADSGVGRRMPHPARVAPRLRVSRRTRELEEVESGKKGL